MHSPGAVRAGSGQTGRIQYHCFHGLPLKIDTDAHALDREGCGKEGLGQHAPKDPAPPPPPPSASGSGSGVRKPAENATQQEQRPLTTSSSPTELSQVPERLEAAKPVSWRGSAGELPQLPFECPRKGYYLVIDLWSGTAGLIVALLAMGFRIVVLAVEMDEVLAKAVGRVFPNVVQMAKVEDVKGALFEKVLSRRSFDGIVIGGGSPCQGNSSLNSSRKGLGDPRSWQPVELIRIVAELKPYSDPLPIFTFLENVASMPAQVKSKYSELIGGPPLLIDAKECGWVHRDRAIWVTGPSGTPNPSKEYQLPEGFQLQRGPDMRIVNVGGKQWPQSVSFAGGFKVLFVPQQVAAGSSGRCFHIFTREFHHPTDRVRRASPQAAERFFADARRFPPTAYEDHSLVWRGEEWKQPDPEDRARIHGIPVALIQEIARDDQVPARKTARQNSAIGNGYHIPSLMLALCILFQLAPASQAAEVVLSPWQSVEEERLKGKVTGTVFEPGLVEAFPGLFTAQQIVADMVDQLAGIPVDPVCIEALLSGSNNRR